MTDTNRTLSKQWTAQAGHSAVGCLPDGGNRRRLGHPRIAKLRRSLGLTQAAGVPAPAENGADAGSPRRPIPLD